MKKYFISVTTQYDGYEFNSKYLLLAKNKREAGRIINTKGYYAHDNGIELIQSYSIKELTDAEYEFLCKFI